MWSIRFYCCLLISCVFSGITIPFLRSTMMRSVIVISTKWMKKTGLVFGLLDSHKKWNASFSICMFSLYISYEGKTFECGSKINYSTIYFIIQINCLHLTFLIAPFRRKKKKKNFNILLSHPIIRSTQCDHLIIYILKPFQLDDRL